MSAHNTAVPLLTSITGVDIGVIGGSGLYQLDGLRVIGEINPETPWGFPSDHIVICESPSGTKIAFLARHGRGHYLTPTEVPGQANIAALKHIGVKVIIAFSAVGSLRQEIPPRDFVIPSQIIDRTKGIRASTYFGNGVVGHVSFGDPFSADIGEILYSVRDAVVGNHTVHKDKTLVCMEGPAFSTRAESHMYRVWGGDVINMSVLPEAKLAREAEIAYQMVCMATDYDCWKVEEEAVTVETVIGNLNANADNARRLLLAAIPVLEAKLAANAVKSVNDLKNSVAFSVMTAPHKRNPEQIKKMQYILPAMQ
ncbi:nucleoside phosphorylase domain-containing protein [Entophlyctis helioformis]|nr:nucleoside phosphorylase domain-containing protein [Entophlyctis helioformis]